VKLYLSSYRVPVPEELTYLLGKPLADTLVALIPNAKDYYSERARNFKVQDLVKYMEGLGLHVTVVDLRDYTDPTLLEEKLAAFDLIWAMGGNTYMLRYEMRRSGFEKIIKGLLETGIVYGGDSAGALVAGPSIAGVESADEPEFAEELVTDGLHLEPFAVLPHVDNPEFTDVIPIFHKIHEDKDIIELKDSQVVVFNGNDHHIAEADNS
jgi:dipeptidase E